MACICGNAPKRKDSMAARRHDSRCLDLKEERSQTLAGQIMALPEYSPVRLRLEAKWDALTGRNWNGKDGEENTDAVQG